MKDPVVYREYGFKSLVFAAVFGVAAVGFYAAGAVQRSGIGKTAEIEAAACSEKFTALGASASGDGGAVRAQWADLGDPSRVSGAASAGALACPGWEVKSFCMGTGCAQPGASIELQRVGGE